MSVAGAGARVLAEDFGLRPDGAQHPVLDGVDLVIEPGQIVLLTGASGAGKSTLLHALAGLFGDQLEREPGPGRGVEAEEGVAAYRGRLEVDGVPSVPAATRELAGRVGLVQQDPETQVVLSRIGDDVAFGAENLGVDPDAIWPRVREALAAVGLGSLPLNHPTAALSGGQKQRLAVAGLLAMGPGLWLLDEPTANLDPEGAAQVRDVVLDTARATGATVIVVEHRLELWLDVPGVDRLVVLGMPGAGAAAREGLAPDSTADVAASGATGARVIADGEPSALLRDDAVARSLAAHGVWVPGRRPELVPFEAPAGGAPLLAVCDLAATRHAVPRRRAARARLAQRDGAVPVSGVDLDVRAGRATCLLGRNGQGKTALSLTLAGLQRPVAGAVEALPALREDSRHETPSDFAPRELVTRIGMVFQDPEHQFVARTVRAELAFGPRRAGVPDEEVGTRVDELLLRLHLDHVAESNPYSLSGGQKRRLSVGTALAARPRLLVLDEPTFGQDAVTWVELVKLLREELERGTAVVAVTHDEAFAEALDAARVLVSGGTARILEVAA